MKSLALLVLSGVAVAKSCLPRSVFPEANLNSITLASTVWTRESLDAPVQMNAPQAIMTLNAAMEATSHHGCSDRVPSTFTSNDFRTLSPSGDFEVPLDVFFRNDGGLVYADLQMVLGWMRNLVASNPNNPSQQVDAIHGYIQNYHGESVGNFNLGLGLPAAGIVSGT